MLRSRVTLLLVLAAALALPSLQGCDAGPSEPEYLELVDEWMERDSAIRDRAFMAAGEDAHDELVELAAEAEALCVEMEAVEPPEGLETLHDQFVRSERHFADALTALGRGEDFVAIDELTVSNEARRRMKDELAKLEE